MMNRLRAPKLTLRLRPLGGGALTELRLTGPIYSAPPVVELRDGFALLQKWHGRPLDVALCVDETSTAASWVELWEQRLGSLPARLHRVRLAVRRAALLRPTTVTPEIESSAPDSRRR